MDHTASGKDGFGGLANAFFLRGCVIFFFIRN